MSFVRFFVLGHPEDEGTPATPTRGGKKVCYERLHSGMIAEV